MVFLFHVKHVPKEYINKTISTIRLLKEKERGYDATRGKA